MIEFIEYAPALSAVLLGILIFWIIIFVEFLMDWNSKDFMGEKNSIDKTFQPNTTKRDLDYMMYVELCAEKNIQAFKEYQDFYFHWNFISLE